MPAFSFCLKPRTLQMDCQQDELDRLERLKQEHMTSLAANQAALAALEADKLGQEALHTAATEQLIAELQEHKAEALGNAAAFRQELESARSTLAAQALSSREATFNLEQDHTREMEKLEGEWSAHVSELKAEVEASVLSLWPLLRGHFRNARIALENFIQKGSLLSDRSRMVYGCAGSPPGQSRCCCCMGGSKTRA